MVTDLIWHNIIRPVVPGVHPVLAAGVGLGEVLQHTRPREGGQEAEAVILARPDVVNWLRPRILDYKEKYWKTEKYLDLGGDW